MAPTPLLPAQQKAAVRALALVAWSDRVLTPEERASIVARAATLTGLSARQVETALDEGKNLHKYGADWKKQLAPLATLPSDRGIELLRQCYEVGAVDGDLPETELKTIERVAAVFVPRHKVIHVVRWLKARQELLRIEREMATLPEGTRLVAKIDVEPEETIGARRVRATKASKGKPATRKPATRKPATRKSATRKSAKGKQR